MIEKAIEQIRSLYEKGEYFKAIEFLKSIPDSSIKTEIELWAFIFIPVSPVFHDFKLGSIIEKKVNNTTNKDYSYLHLLEELAICKLIQDELINRFEINKIPILKQKIQSIKQQFAHLYSVTNSPETQFLLDEAFLAYIELEGNVSGHEKNNESALEFYFKGLKKAQKLQANLAIYKFLFRLNYFFGVQGELGKSVEYALKRLDQAYKMNNLFLRLDACNALGLYFGWHGEKEESIKYFQLGISYSENNDDIVIIKWYLMLLSNLGQVEIDYSLQCEGIKNLEKSKNKLKYYLNVNMIDQAFFSRYFPDILFGMFNYWYSLNDNEQCQVILSEFSNIITDLDDLSLNKYKFCKARFLLKKGRILDKSTAIPLLDEIISSKKAWFELTFPSLILLTQLLIEDYKNTDDPAIIKEINSYIEHISSSTDSIQINVNLGILNSKMLLLEGRISEAEIILEENLKITNEFELYNEKQLIKQELSKLREEKSKWKELLANNPYDLEKIQLEHIKTYLEEAQKFISTEN